MTEPKKSLIKFKDALRVLDEIDSRISVIALGPAAQPGVDV